MAKLLCANLTWPSPTPAPGFCLTSSLSVSSPQTPPCFHWPEICLSSAASEWKLLIPSHSMDVRPGMGHRSVLHPHSLEDLASAFHACYCCLLPTPLPLTFSHWLDIPERGSLLPSPDCCHRLRWLEHPCRQLWWFRGLWASDDAFLHTWIFIDNR